MFYQVNAGIKNNPTLEHRDICLTNQPHDYLICSPIAVSLSCTNFVYSVPNITTKIVSYLRASYRSRTCEETIPRSDTWKVAAQAASVARVNAELEASRLQARLNLKCTWCPSTHKNTRELCAQSLELGTNRLKGHQGIGLG